MIQPATLPDTADVARHYDELDYFYRDVWGEHVHHGVWHGSHDRTPVDEATLRLLYLAVRPLRLVPGQSVADVGCGYGAASRWLAASFGVNVTGLTLSPAQAAEAERQPPPPRGAVSYHVADWLANDLPTSSLDAAVAIESLAHMPDKPAFFEQLRRTLKPGGKAALACWLTADHPNRFERHLLEKICEEGRLPGMGTVDDYTTMAEDAGLRVLGHRDLTLEVERTWWIIARRLAGGLVTKRRYLSFLVNRAFRERIFLFTLPRLMLAYRTGAMRYGLIWVERPIDGLP